MININNLLEKHHNLSKLSSEEKKVIKATYTDFFNKYNNNPPYSISENWIYRERQAKFIVNSTRSYQFFGSDLRLPFFDNELLDFFKELPYSQKLFKSLYNETLEEFYFKPLGLFFETDNIPKPIEYRKQKMKNTIKSLFPILKDVSFNKTDNICYREISNYLFDHYKYEKRNHFSKVDLNAPIVDWYLQLFHKTEGLKGLK